MHIVSLRCALVGACLIAVGTVGHAAEESAKPADSSEPAASKEATGDGAATDQAAKKSAGKDSGKVGDLLNLDLEQLGKVPVRSGSRQTNLTSPSSQMTGKAAETGEATTTADLLKQAPSVSARRVSAITMDPRVRGYHSSQLNATANGMNQLKARLDIDTLFSQIDPGIVDNITVIDGPYTSLYGPGFAFMIADLLPAPRFETSQAHVSSNFVYGSNAQTLYTRDNLIGGGKDWGVCVSYGLRDGNDYRTGGPNGYLLPSRYQKWDGMMAVSYDLNPVARLEFDCLRTEMNDVELPGVLYDIESSKNDQFNLKYTIQEDPKGPKQFVLQSWYSQTFYDGSAAKESKQRTFYQAYIAAPYLASYDLVNTTGAGDMESMGTRLLRTFGETDSLQWTVGADWRRNQQRYLEETWDSQGGLAWDTLYGVPRGRLDDVGALTDVMLPVSDTVSVNIGGRIDYCQATLDMMDPIVSQSDYTAFTPRFAENSHALGMAYVTSKKKLTEETSLNGGIAFAMRNPDLTELYNFEAFVPQYRFGNTFNDGLSTLRPEKNLQLDLGLARQTKKVSYGVRGFYSTIHDYILPSPCYLAQIPPYADATTLLGRNFSYFPASQRADLGTPSENADTCQANYVYVNVDQVSMLGGDLYGDYEVREGISVFGNMSYVYAVNNTPVAVLSDPPYYSTDIQLVHLGVSDGIPGIYPLSGNVGIRFFEPKDDIWSVSFSAKMVRAQDHVAVTLAEVPAPGYTTFALRGYYRVRKNVRVSLDIDNLFNRAYVEPGSLAIIGPDGKPTFVEEPGISALMGVEARF